MDKIETGVDKLVELISQVKSISIDDAAKKLGISKVVIQEWADFLDEEKLITLEYKFSKTILKERKLSEKEVKEKQKEYSSEKDAFVRKVESSLRSLDGDSMGLEKIKKEFETLKKDLGTEIVKVEKEVKDLEKYEYLKQNLDKEILKQIAEFHQIIDSSHKDIDAEQKRHQGLLEDLEIEKREFQVKEKRIMSLEEKESELMKRIQEIVEVAKDVEKRIGNEKSSLSESEKKILNLQKVVTEIEDAITRKKKDIEPLITKARKHEEQILALQEDILSKSREKTKAIKSQVDEGAKATAKFKEFFDKKSVISNLIAKIEGEKKELEEMFKALQKKAVAFDLSTKSNVVSSHVKQLEKEYNDINKRKSVIKEDLEKLIKLIKG
jgi:chromosome segregation ATPase